MDVFSISFFSYYQCLLFVPEEEELYLFEKFGCYFCDFVFLLFCGIMLLFSSLREHA